jgi:phosphoenolpyruvate-protein kinase (PTS system EI component)
MLRSAAMKLGLILSGERPTSEVVSKFDNCIGMIRGEYLFRDVEKYVLHPAGQAFQAEYLEWIASRNPDAEVWYRTSDFDLREAAVLDGVEDTLVEERGIKRGLRFTETLQIEFATFRDVQRRHQNLHIMFPFISCALEAECAYRLALEAGLEGPIGVMAETPAAILELPEILEIGYAKVVVGCNDLYALTMGVRRGPGIAPTRSVALERLIKQARDHTARADIPLEIAGYYDESLRAMADEIGVDRALFHYSQLPVFFGHEYQALPELSKLRSIKQKSRSAIALLDDSTLGNK